MDTHSSQHQDFKLRRVLIILLIFVAMMRLILSFLHEANWDEYLNLSMVYDFQRGELREILQTGFVHLFHWVSLVSQNEADQIIAIRLLYMCIGLITSLAIWNITKELASKNAAYFAVLCYWTLGFNLIHGVSFRTDPLAACVMMCVLWLIICRPPTFRVALMAGALVGLAGVFTIKAVFYLPAVVLVALIRSHNVKRGWLLIVIAGLAAAISFFGLVVIHAATFPNVASPFAFLNRTVGSTMSTQDFSILLVYLKYALFKDALFFYVLGTGIFGVLVQLIKPTQRIQALIALALLTPLLSVLVYRDVYPYYYPFIFAPVVVLAGFTWQLFAQRFDARVMLLVAFGLCFNAAMVTLKKLEYPIMTQRTVLDVIHSNFPINTTYIDGRSMVSSMKKRGIFMSAWGMTDYRYSGQLIMENIIRSQQPQFLLANSSQLMLNKFSAELSNESPMGLFGDDFRVLQENYIQFWGPIYLPGKVIQANDTEMTIALPGTYRLISGVAVTVDGKVITLGDSVYLEARNYSVTTSDMSTLMLDVPIPQTPPPERNVFGGF